MSIENLTQIIENLNINPSTDSESRPVTFCTPISADTLDKMAQFKPEFLNCVPNFDGNPNDLYRYLSVCESLINTFYNNANLADFQNVYLLNSLISKLSGNAKLVVNI